MATDKTLNVDENLLNRVIREKLEKKNILSLNEDENRSIYTLAISLGVKQNKRVPSTKTTSYLRFSAIKEHPEYAYICAVALRDLKDKGQDNKINDEDEIRKIVEEYVNGGLMILDEMIGDINEFDEEIFILKLLQEMDEAYQIIYGE